MAVISIQVFSVFSSSFPLKLCMHYFSPHICYIPCPSHLNNILWGAQIMQLLIMQFPSVSSFFHPRRPKYLSQYSTLKCLQSMFSLSVKNQVINPYKTTCKITVLYSLFILIDSTWEYKWFLAEWWQVYPKFPLSSQTIQVPEETVFWYSLISPEYQQLWKQHILHADKYCWLPDKTPPLPEWISTNPSSCTQS